jgi:hypothetical protein
MGAWVGGNVTVEPVMRSHVFSQLPKYCAALKPGMLWVRCSKCGRPHQEYFGPKDRDERNAEIVFLRHELGVAMAIALGRHRPERPDRVRARGRAR